MIELTELLLLRVALLRHGEVGRVERAADVGAVREHVRGRNLVEAGNLVRARRVDPGRPALLAAQVAVRADGIRALARPDTSDVAADAAALGRDDTLKGEGM